jgi:glycosyltransferase involved in cell wall biosynthesis
LIGTVGHHALRNCSKVTAVSHYVKNLLEEFYKVPSSKIEIVYNGVNIDDFRCEESTNKKWSLGKNVVLILKPYDPRKGLHYLIQTLEIVKKQLPSLTLVALGPRPTGSYGKFITSLIDNSCVKEDIVFTGKVSFKDLKSLYHQSDIIAIPSLQEGFSITALEAGACSKPIVGFDQGGLAEAVIDRTTGLLVPLGDVASLAEAIETLLADEKLRHRLGTNAQNRIRSFQWKKIAVDVENVYLSASNRVLKT